MIGLLSGRFDPVHSGHLALARAAMVAGGLHEVWLMADPAPWHKAVIAERRHRLAMLELAAADELGVRLVEPDLREVSHTIAGFRQVMDRWPGESFVFILGMDALGRLDRWDDFETIVKTTSLMGAQRLGTPATVVDDLRRRLGPLGNELRVQLFEFDDQASSTQVREQLAAGERPVWLDPRVYEYILKHGLYH